MKISARKTKKTGPTPAQTTAQSWLPIQDLHDGCLFRPDGGVVAGVQIAPLSLALKSERERLSAIQGFQAALNGLNVPWQILSLYRPVDLDSYLAFLDNSASEVTGPRRRVLNEYARWVRTQIQGGESVERRYYLLLTRFGKDALAEHAQSLRGLAEDAGRIRGFRADILSDARWRELLFLMFHAGQAAVESIPDGGARHAPIYIGRKDG